MSEDKPLHPHQHELLADVQETLEKGHGAADNTGPDTILPNIVLRDTRPQLEPSLREIINEKLNKGLFEINVTPGEQHIGRLIITMKVEGIDLKYLEPEQAKGIYEDHDGPIITVRKRGDNEIQEIIASWAEDADKPE